LPYLFLGVSGVLTRLLDFNVLLVFIPVSVRASLDSKYHNQHKLIAMLHAFNLQWALKFARPDENTLVFVCV